MAKVGLFLANSLRPKRRGRHDEVAQMAKIFGAIVAKIGQLIFGTSSQTGTLHICVYSISGALEFKILAKVLHEMLARHTA